MNNKAGSPKDMHWLTSCRILAPALAEQALQGARQQRLTLVKYLVDNALVDSTQLASTLARAFNLPLADLDAFHLDPRTLATVSRALQLRHRMVPLFRHSQTLWLGSSDPDTRESTTQIRFQTGCKPVTVLVEEHKLAPLLQRLQDDTAPDAGRGDSLAQRDFDDIHAAEQRPVDDGKAAVSDSPVTRLVDKMLQDARHQAASDIHIEPFEHHARIRFRQDGMLREIARPTSGLASRITARLKIMARLDIAEKRLPQDGRIKLDGPHRKKMEYRINTLPTLWGEKTVLRLLDQGPDRLELDGLGFTPAQKQLYVQALQHQQGLILVTGPTGSGKSLSLYAGLNLLNTRERNIATVEDPVEIHLDGINQVPVNARIGLDFAHALRAFLRQDPDILMVGEIRDPETAKIAVRAAQTGHLVMSTLHTNSAPETLARLLDMDIAPYQLATSLSLIIAQRLLRRLCTRCKKPLQLPDNMLIHEGFSPDSLDRITLFEATGCSVCHDGYRGRTGIFETVPITGAISRVMMDAGNSIQIEELAAKAGFNSLRDSALEKAAQGLTSLHEVNRVTSSSNTEFTAEHSRPQ